MFKKILIANRGEIAVRVIRACREMGIASVAVYSDVDRASLAVLKADEAYRLGPAPAAESYLNIPKILEAARQCGAEAIHPGYGFLSENSRFAQACEDAGIKFIGPSAKSMEMMGSKTRARQNMERSGIPFVPGTSKGLDSSAQAREIAEKIGYPMMLKAAAGGGGKGMRLVNSSAELNEALESARSEALRAFGSDEVYIEKAILQPRHIEMQIFADEQGNTVYLGERECSLQRRHQKVLEESPSPVVDGAMRQRMGEVAVGVARAANYANAGTIEFLVDLDKNFYFLEMNTRLQVEHPVTELVTGLDLVQLQIRVAAGEPLPFRQEDVVLRGHAIECRIYAEDPDNNYFPSPGEITAMQEPAGPGIRLDSGIYDGWNVPIDYDPLLSKLIAFGSDREQATARMRRAIEDYFVGGITTNLSLFRTILNDPNFKMAKFHTSYLDSLVKAKETREEETAVAAIAAALFAALEPAAANGAKSAPCSAWKKAARTEALQ
jgi:acetyl-CoA carboxylase, biotin carboxylase subunit